jgi:hypothetical protein
MSDSRLDRDLEALRAVSAKDVPELDSTMRNVRRRVPVSGRRLWNLRRNIMAALDSVRTRPAVAAVVVGALLVVVAMVVPVSYQRVVGQDVALTFAGKGIGREQIGAIARALKGVLGSDGVVVDASAMDQGTQFVLRATSPQRSGARVQRVAGEFARGLAAKGYSASFQVAPHRERVRYPAAAYAWDQIIRISVDGKSAAQLQSEIQRRLSEAGVPDAQVSVTDRPEGGREINMKVERQAVGDGSAATPEPMPQVVLTKEGAPLAGGEGLAVKIRKMKRDDAVTLIVEVTLNDKSAKAEVPNSQSMSDAALADAISGQLKQQGIDAKVTVVGGKVSVEPVK